MAKRHRDAHFAQAGACNSLALAHSLAAAIKEAREEYGTGNAAADADPAVRLIAHQLCFLLNVSQFDSGADPLAYVRAVEACEARKDEPAPIAKTG